MNCYWLLELNSYVVNECQVLIILLHLVTFELWFGQEQKGVLPELLSSSSLV